jgi:hypothetical protein
MGKWATLRLIDEFYSYGRTVHMDPGMVINRHKHAANRPNKLLKGHHSGVAKVKKQIDNQD